MRRFGASVPAQLILSFASISVIVRAVLALFGLRQPLRPRNSVGIGVIFLSSLDRTMRVANAPYLGQAILEIQSNVI